MRVIGGRDYYDSASAYGVDPGIVFVRQPRHLTMREFNSIHCWKNAESIAIMKASDEERQWKTHYVLERGLLGRIQINISDCPVIFCGKVYTGILIQCGEINGPPSEKHYFWNKEKLEAFLDSRGWKLTKLGLTYRNKDCRPLFETAEITGDALNALLDMQIAVAYPTRPSEYRHRFDGDESRWCINGDGLKDVEFQRAIEPVMAFQELAQWVGGTLASVGPNIVEIIDDKIKIAKHGMDKWSFRKHKLDK